MRNDKFEFTIAGGYANLTISENTFSDNNARKGTYVNNVYNHLNIQNPFIFPTSRSHRLSN